MKIEVFFRQVYGNQLIYPSCDKAKALAAFAGCRVFSPTQIALLRGIGVEVMPVPDPRTDGLAADPYGPQSDNRGRS